jgi:hypothetical protein
MDNIIAINCVLNNINRQAFLIEAMLPVRYKMKFETLFSRSADYDAQHND